MVRVSESALPAGGATEAKQDDGNASLADIDAALDAPLSTRASETTLAAFESANHTDLAGVQTRQDTGNGTLASILAMEATAANQDTTNTKLDTLHADNLAIEGKQDTQAGLTVSTNTKLDTLHSDFGVAEGKQDAQTTQLTAINANTDGIETLVTASNTKLDTGNTSAATTAANTGTISGKLGTLGQKTMAGSAPMVLASDQSAIPVSQNGAPWSQNISQVGGASLVLGQAPAANSIPVVTQADAMPATQSIITQDISSATVSAANAQPFILGTPTAGSAASFAISSFEGLEIQVTGVWTGTITLEVSMDGGTLWSPRGVKQTGSPYIASSFTANFWGGMNATGITNVRARATAAMTGTAIVRIIASQNAASIIVSNPTMLRDGVIQSTLNTIKAASTAALATDTAVVVAISPNNTPVLPSGAATSALQGTGNTALSAIQTSVASIDTDIDVALSTRASAAVQTSGGQKTQVVDGSGNVQPSGDAVARRIFVSTTDGTNTVTVKAASTAAVASDTAMVVAISPNNTISTKTSLTANAPGVVSVGVASAAFLASNAARKGLLVHNNSAATISYAFGTAAILNSGITLYPGGFFSMDEYSFSTAAINAIAGTAASSSSYQEFQT